MQLLPTALTSIGDAQTARGLQESYIQELELHLTTVIKEEDITIFVCLLNLRNTMTILTTVI
jgi:hypothetical protein